MKYFIVITRNRPCMVIGKVKAADSNIAHGVLLHSYHRDVYNFIANSVKAEINPYQQRLVEVEYADWELISAEIIDYGYVGYYVVNTETGEIVGYITTALSDKEADAMVQNAINSERIPSDDYSCERVWLDELEPEGTWIY